MNTRSYSRASFDNIRQAERQRFQELSAVRAEFNLAESWLAAAVENGTDPAEARAQRETIRAEDERRAAAADVHLLPGGPVDGAAAVELLTRSYFGRPDVAATVQTPRRVEHAGRGRDALARVAGLGGQGCDPWQLWLGAVEGAQYRLSSSLLGEVSAQPAGGLPAAVREALLLIVRHDWARSGAFWMAASMVVDGIDFRPRRHWIAQASVQDSEIVPEAGEPPHSPDGGASGWMYADLQVAQRKESTLLSRQRVFNVGGVELGAWVSARLALWHDGLDQQVASLLASAPVRTVQGLFDAGHFAAAVAAVNTQKVGGVVLGSSRPILLAGENRRALMSAVPGPARASGDEAAVLSSVVYSASVPADFLCLIHPMFQPCAVAGLGGRLDPMAALGKYAGVRQDGAMSERGAVVYQDRSDPALCLDSKGNAVGVVRMVMQ